MPLNEPQQGPRVGTLLADRFQVLEVIGRGGMGIVVRARDLLSGTEVAVKHVRPDLAEDPDYADRLRREAQLARTVSHHNICRVHDVYRHGDEVLLSMEYVHGETLRKRLDRGPLRREEALSIARQICEGVAAAHQKGVVHRDLKPENVLIDKNGRAVVLDFGVARKDDAPRDTITGMAMGTPRYMAPEQQQGRATSPATDVFALGLVIEELFGDQRPPSWLRPVIRRATERDALRRYTDAAALGRDLHYPYLRRGGLLLAGCTGVALIGLVPWLARGLFTFSPSRSATDKGAAATVTESLTRPWSGAHLATISPDGTLLAFVENCDRTMVGYVRQIEDKDGQGRQFSTTGHSVAWISFSPDGKRIAYSDGDHPTDRSSTIYLVDLQKDGPGKARKLGSGMTPSFSPDGRSLLISRYNSRTGRSHLARVPLDGAAEPTFQNIEVQPPGDPEVAPVLSPDGKRLAYLTYREGGLIMVAPAEGGRAVPLPAKPAIYDRLQWSADSRHVLFSTMRQGLQAVEAQEDGKSVLLVPDTQDPRSPSLSADGTKLVYTRDPPRFDLRVASREGKELRRLPFPVQSDTISFPLLASDGRTLAVAQDSSGSDGPLRRVQLRDGAQERPVYVIRVGRPMSFVANNQALIIRRDGDNRLQVISLKDGVAPPQIPFHDLERSAAVSPDGKRLATTRGGQGEMAQGVWVRALGAAPETAVRWIPDGEGVPAWSPDGRVLAAGTTEGGVALAESAESLRRVRPMRVRGTLVLTRNLAFTRDNKLLVLDNPRVYEFDLEKEKTRPLLDFPQVSYIFGFALAQDSQEIVYVAQEQTGDIWLLKQPDRLLAHN